MEAAYVSALFGLVGVSLGGLTSFSTTWLTQRTQARDKRRDAEQTARIDLFNAFVVEASRLYGDALTHQKDDVTDLIQLYALVARMRLWASRPVVTAAEDAMSMIIETYLEPNRTLHEMHALARTGHMNFLLEFGEACRAELGMSMAEVRQRSAARSGTRPGSPNLGSPAPPV